MVEEKPVSKQGQIQELTGWVELWLVDRLNKPDGSEKLKRIALTRLSAPGFTL